MKRAIYSKITILTLLLITSSLTLLAQEVCDDGIDNDGDGLIDCYDPDCYASDACGFYDADYCRSILPDSKEFGMQLDNNFVRGAYQAKGAGPSFTYAPMGYAIPKVADIDNDGIMEIVTVSSDGGDDGIFIFDPINNQLKYFIPLVVANNHTGVTLANVDADPYVEIIIATGLESTGDNSIYRFDFDGISWNQYTNGSWPIQNAYTRRGFQPDVVDFNEDGKPELLFYGEQLGSKTAKIYNVENGAVLVDLISATGGATGYLASHLYWKDHFAYADVIPEGFNPGTGALLYAKGVEFITATRVYTVDITTGNVEDVWGSHPTGVHNPWVNGHGDVDAGQKVSLADINVDGKLDIVAVGQGRLSVWNPTTNASICTTVTLGGAEKGGVACIGDVDGDALNQPEIGVVSKNYVEVFRYNASNQLEQVWGLGNSDASGETACNFFDFEGDGSVEMVYRDTYDLWVYEGEGDGSGNEKVLLTSNQVYNDANSLITSVDACSSATGSEHPIIVDVDQNNRADIVVCCKEGLRVYRDRYTPWISSRGIFNQRSYSYVNINNDMSVPAKMQQNHIVPSLNNYLTQMYKIDKAGNPFYPAPDFTIEVKSIDDLCHGAARDQVNFVLNIFNYGDGHADKFEVPITFYDGNPALPGARFLKQEIVMVDLLPLNAKESHVFDIPMSDLAIGGAQMDAEIYVTINDNLKQSTLVGGFTTVGTTLPNSPYPECDYGNNTIGPFVMQDCQLLAPMVDLDEDNNNTGGYHTTDYATTYSEGAGQVSISDTDVKIIDNGTQIASAIIEIYNPLDGEAYEGLFWNNTTLNSYGITTANNQGDTKVTISGVQLIAQYEKAIELFKYENSSAIAYADDRLIIVRVIDADGGMQSGSAVCHFTMDTSNDKPTSEDKTVTTEENTNFFFNGSEFAFSDPDGDKISKVQINTLPAKGRLFSDNNLNGIYNAGEEIVAGKIFTINELYAGLLKYEPIAGESGILASDYIYSSFAFYVNDGTENSATTNTLTIRVLPDNFPPTAADNGETIDEDTDFVFNNGDFNFNDLDATDALYKVLLVSTPGAGVLYNDANTDGVVDGGEAFAPYDEILRADMDNNQIKFKPATNGFGSPYAYFNFKVNDAVQNSVDYYTFTFHVNPIPDNPVISASSTSVPEGHTGTILTVTATDGDPSDNLTFSISGGDDAGDFSIDPSTGKLTFNAIPDYENPADNGTNNVYDITVQVEDALGATDSKAIQITVTNVIDALTIEFTSATFASPENVGGNLPTLSISGEVLPSDVTIQATIVGGSATVTDDYTNTALITIPAGDYTSGGTQEINLSIVDETLCEANETISFLLANASSGVTIGTRTTSTYTIQNDDNPIITLSLSNSPLIENGGVATITATSDILSDFDITVNLGFAGTAAGSDYNAGASNIVIKAGDTTGSTTITGVDDAIYEGSETVIVDITSVTNGTESGAQQVTASIADNDVAPVVTLSASSISISEEGGVSTLTATLSTATTADVTVTIGVTGGSASASDYNLSSTTITILAGATTGTATLTGSTDLIYEGSETAVVEITGVSGGSATEHATAQSRTITITDNEVAPVVTLSASPISISEESGVSTLTATLSTATTANVTVSIGVTGGSASASDYSLSSTTITILAGATTGTATLTGSSDLIYEGSETAVVEITGVSGGSATEHATAQSRTITITDNEVAPVVTLSASPISISEDGGVSTLTATLSTATTATITVTIGVTGGSASASDYSLSSTTITILAGATTGTATLTGSTDLIYEGSETAVVEITGVSGGSATEHATTQSETITITDNEVAPVVTLSASPISISEEGGISTLTATLSTATTVNVTVTIGVTGGTASASDYNLSSTTITILAGATTGTATLTGSTDLIYEGSETAVVEITGVSGGSAAEHATPQSRTITITDNEVAPVVTLLASPISISEEGGISTLTATLSTATTANVTVTIGVTGGSASASDYSLSSTTITILAGATTGTATLTGSTDAIYEGSETAVVEITGVSGGSATEHATPQSRTITITDNEVAPVVTLLASPISISEEGGVSTLTATLSTATTADVTVTIGVTGGTASASDYSLSSTTITILAGATTGTATLTGSTDAIYEGSETAVVEITGVSGGSATEHATPQSRTITITDNEVAPVITLSASPISISEEGGISTLTATLSTATTANVTVTIGVTGGTASPSDYSLSSTTITILAGATTGTATLTGSTDLICEPTENVVIDITNVSGGSATESGDQSETIDITDNDTALVQIAANDATADESGNNDGQFTVTLSSVSSTDTEVNYTLGGTATAGDDYTTLTGKVTIPAGSTSATINIAVMDDAQVEPDETAIISLTSLIGDADITIDSDNDEATVTISDNDGIATLTVEDITINENGSNSFTVKLDKAVQGGFQINYSFVDGSAVGGTDFVNTTGTKTFVGTAGESVSITVAGINDDIVEGSETFTLKLSTVNTLVDADDNAKGTIIDDDATNVTIENVTATEGGVAKFTITLNKAIVGGTTITYTLAGGTATEIIDFNSASGAVDFVGNAGETQTFDVALLEDAIVEDSETFMVSLSSSNNDVGADDTATGTITDNDTATVSISANDPTADESESNNGQFTVVLSTASSTDTEVSYALSGSATAGDDYTTLTGKVTIPAGSTSAIINVTVTNDAIVESDETVIVTLSSLNGDTDITIDTDNAEATLTISDVDEATVSISANDASANESGSNNGQFTVTLSSASSTDTEVSYTLSGSATAVDDYAVLTGKVTISAGSKEATIDVNVNNDDVLEGDETVIITLSAVLGDDQISIDTDNDEATVTISDSDVATVSISANDATADESGSNNGQFTVTLSSASSTDTEVSYTLSGSASEGSDYTALTGKVTIPAGSTSATINVEVVNDNVVEGDETTIVTLSAVLGDNEISIDTNNNEATVTISDNDTATVSISANDATADESGNNDGQFTVTLSSVSSTDTEVSYTLGGTATAGDDYTTLEGKVTIPAGSASATVNIAVIDDAQVEPDETAILTITSLDGDTEISIDTDNDEATVTISGNDGIATLTVEDITIDENGFNNFTVKLDKAVQGGFEINYSFTDGTAVGGTDYDNTVGVKTFVGTAGESVSITVNGINDEIVEGSETFTLELSTLNTLVDADDTAKGTVIDDDATNVTIENVTEKEGGVAKFTITLNKAIDGGTTITYSLTGGTATEIIDFDSASGKVDFVGNAGETQTFDVALPEDEVVERDETFNIALSSSNAFVGADDTAIGTITDNDGKATVTVEDISAAEGEVAKFTVTLDKEVQDGVDIDFNMIDGTAILGDDYNATSGVLKFVGNAGETQTFEVTLLNDNLAEGDETYTVELSSLNTLVDATDKAIGTILDDDVPEISVTLSDDLNQTSEDGTSDSFEVALNTQPTSDVVINITGVDATEGSLDVLTLTFTPLNWAQPQTVTVTGLNDDEVDGSQKYTLTLSVDNDLSDDTYKDLSVPVEVMNTDNDLPNSAPIANDNSAEVETGKVLNGASLLANDTDAEGDELTINTTPVSEPVNGILVINTDGTYTYTPDEGFVGEDSFEYEVCDNGIPQACATATVKIKVTNPDNDGDGITNIEEGDGDTDGDGILDKNDLDSDDDGISDEYEGNIDTDGDGTPDYKDTDSDDDGISDAIEGNEDTNGDGIPDYKDTDSDGDGISDAIEGNVDTDGDSIPDFKDTDSDGDSISDEYEGNIDTDGDGTANYKDMDSDDDTILDQDEGAIDQDEDGDDNYRDLDSDDDGILDRDEGNIDTDNDGTPNFLDEDSDDDGVLDQDESRGDCDNDGIKDYIDVDKCYTEDDLPLYEGFSPNNDGDNDRYVIPWLNQYTKVSIEIFNRWGNVVYKQDSYENNWNGESNVGFSIGEELPVSTYFYIIHIHDINKKLNGYIYLNR